MPQAFDTIVVPTVPGALIDTNSFQTDSAAITTTETVVLSVTASVVSGRTYDIVGEFGFRLSVANDVFDVFIKEDGTTGTQLQRRRIESDLAATSFLSAFIQTRFIASITEEKTFVVSAVRSSGTGSLTRTAASSAPSIINVIYQTG